MLDALKQQVLEANLELVRRGLVVASFGNASGFDRERGLVVIKPSGVAYDRLTMAELVVTDLDGRVVEGALKPSSDLPTHLVLYRAFRGIGGVAHTHSRHAAAWAQAAREIPCLGTTHADYFHGPIPVTDWMSDEQIASGYERETGLAIARRFEALDPLAIPGVLVAGHGPFTWGPTAGAASDTAAILEEVAAMAAETLALRPDAAPVPRALHDKHFLRKHGPGAYYGQGNRR